MSEQQPPPEDAADETGAETGDGPVTRTGHPVVDEVVDSLEGLEERPVSEHVEVFESAHDRLRAALADAGTDGSA